MFISYKFNKDVFFGVFYEFECLMDVNCYYCIYMGVMFFIIGLKCYLWMVFILW